MGSLDDQVALITGAGSGIGRMIALAFAQEGADIVINDIREDDGPEKVAREVRTLGRRALVVRADVSDRQAVNEMVRTATEAFGPINILVNNAGINIYQPFLEIEQRTWEITMGVDLTGVFNCSQEVARKMAASGRGGKIIIIASVSAEEAYNNQTHYCAAKAGVDMLAKGMAYELGKHCININVINPGWVETPFTYDYLSDPDLRKQVEATIPMGRVAQPEEIARVAVFLASAEADYISGTHIRVDGGLIAGRGKV